MTPQSCNDFRRECERELDAKMTYAGKSGVTLKGEPWPETIIIDDWRDDMSEFWQRVYGK